MSGKNWEGHSIIHNKQREENWIENKKEEEERERLVNQANTVLSIIFLYFSSSVLRHKVFQIKVIKIFGYKI